MAILKDLATHLMSIGAVPEGAVFLHVDPSFEEINNTQLRLIYSLNISTGVSNPKWARDTHYINFRVRGRDKTTVLQAEEAADHLYHELLGHDRLQIGNSEYSQFNSSEAPRFSGFYEGSEPVFSFTLIIATRSLVDIGNRLSY